MMNPRPTTLVSFLLAISCVALGCSRPVSEPTASPQWIPLASESLTPSQIAQKEKAAAARDDLASKLKTRLMEAIAADGLVNAVDVCHREAGQIHRDVAEAHGVAIGRTSFQIRNTMNRPPRWAQPLVKRRVEEPQFMTGPKQQLAALYPIRIKAACLVCHGKEEMLSDEVQSALAQRYPADEATGFAEGDLRGWFWVEVPAE